MAAAVLDEINSGLYDNAIDELANGLPRQGRPVLMRLGYEFNGKWNAYDPDKFKQAWRRIAQRLALDRETRSQVALIWDMSCNENEHTDWEPFYPGDEHVDWWAVNVLDAGDGPSGPDSACVRAFVDAAESRAFPVMIAESMPRDTGTQAEDSWSKWFDPYFNKLLQRPAVKAFSYINRDCRQNVTRKCVGGQWGTARIQDSMFGLGEKYAAALADSRFVHGAELQATCDVLNVKCGQDELLV